MNKQSTRRMRRAFQAGGASLRVLARSHGVNIKTVMRWRARDTITDRPRGRPSGTRAAMSRRDEAIAVFIRRHTQLPIDDCLYALNTIMPQVTRSTLYRCFVRHRVGHLPAEPCRWSRLPGDAYPRVGCIKVDLCPIACAAGPVFLHFAVDLFSRFLYSEVHDSADEATSVEFLGRLVVHYPARIARVITRPIGRPPSATRVSGGPSTHTPISAFCQARGIELVTTAPDHPWSQSQVRAMDRMIYQEGHSAFYPTLQAADLRVQKFDRDFNFSRKLKSLRGLTPFQFLCRTWNESPALFHADPHHSFNVGAPAGR